MPDLIPAVDSVTYQLPDPVRAKIAENLADPATPEGAVIASGGGTIPDATDAIKGKVELATDAETVTGTDTVRAVTPAGVAAAIAAGGGGSTPDATTSVKGKVQLAGDLGGTAAAPTVVASSETVAGKVELATAAETTTGTDNTRAVHPAGLKVELDKKQNLSTLTTKGDIYVATGSSTVTRLGVGSNNQVLTADSAQASGVKWATPSGGGGGGWPAPIPSGSTAYTTYYVQNGSTTPTLGRVVVLPFVLDRAATLTALAVNVTSAGTSGATGYVGVYATNASYMNPDGAALASGSFATTSTGIKAVTGLSVSLSAGVWYWMAYLNTVAAAEVSAVDRGPRGIISSTALRWQRESYPDESYTSLPTLSWGTDEARGWAASGANPLIMMKFS